MKPAVVCNDAFLVCHEIYRAARELVDSRVPTTQLTSASKFLWRPDLRPRLVEYVADFARAGERALGESPSALPRSAGVVEPKKAVAITAFFRPKKVRAVKKVPKASRLVLFRMYYLGGAEYEAARHLLGLSERTWSDWAEEVRQRVGAELIRAHMYPPARYFRQPCADTSGTATPCCAIEPSRFGRTAKSRCATEQADAGMAASTKDVPASENEVGAA